MNSVDNEYKMCDHQSHSILVDGTCPVSEMLDILCNSAGFDTYNSDPGKLIKFRGNKFMKYQKKLTHLKNVISRDHLSDSLLLQHNNKPFNSEDGNFELIEANVTHDGSDAYVSTFGSTTNYTGGLCVFSADISGDDVRLRVTNISDASTVFKFQRIAVDV